MYGALGGFDILEDHESLAFGFQVLFGDEVDDGAVFGEDFCEGFFEVVDLYALFEVFNLQMSLGKHGGSRGVEGFLEGTNVDSGAFLVFVPYFAYLKVTYVEFGGCEGPLRTAVAAIVVQEGWLLKVVRKQGKTEVELVDMSTQCVGISIKQLPRRTNVTDTLCFQSRLFFYLSNLLQQFAAS